MKYPQWTGRRDRRGIPIYVFQIQDLNTKNMAAYNETMNTSNLPTEAQQSSTVPERLLRLFALYENLLRFVMPACSNMSRPNEDTPIVTSTNIVDVSGVGLKQFWNLKGHMQDASVLATAHYPETLDRIFVRSPYPQYPDCVFELTDNIDCRSPLLLPHSLGLDKTLVRPRHDLQDLHPLRRRGKTHPALLHGPVQHPEAIRRRPRLEVGRHA